MDSAPPEVEEANSTTVKLAKGTAVVLGSAAQMAPFFIGGPVGGAIGVCGLVVLAFKDIWGIVFE